MDMFTFYYPDTDSFHATGIYIPGIFDSHLRICGMQAARMLVIQPLFAPDEDLPKWPLI
jgi:hypothetical protein